MKVNILFFCPREVNVTMGGIERVTDTLARHLIKNGFNVVFLSVERTCSKEYESVAQQYFTKEAGNEEWILEIIKKHRISIIINQMSFFHFCSKKALPCNVRVITVMHDSYYAMYNRLQFGFIRRLHWKYVIQRMLRQTYRDSDKIVLFVPEFVDEYRYFCPSAKKDKFVIIPNFNSFSHVDISAKEKKLLWVGRHAETNKRTTDMLKIWAKLENIFPDWSLDVLGDGPDGDVVRDFHARLNLKRCKLCGIQNPEEFYKKASFVCVTSAFESFGMILTEGMQYGCIPFAYDSYTAVRSIINDGIDGILIKPFDTDEYAEKLAALMKNEKKRKEMSNAAVLSVKRFDAERIMPIWIELVNGLCS